ncbi:MAG: endo alpha-1,4 polygalactosaminidase [Chloroflexota bacterium]|nr:endo alpha-1,4 polygalactosaminidase [Chloroflexota bacterium]
MDTSVDAQMYDVDLFNTSPDVVGVLHAQGRRVVCYVSAGTHEDWRPDAADFAGTLVGNTLEDWPGEHWLDIRQLQAIAPVMQRRLDLCQSKGFDGVEFDNVDGYANSSGFPLTASDQLTYNKWLADQAHQRGLSVGLKNDLDQVVELVGDFDWALVEQCFEHQECDRLQPFLQSGKAVFEAEYNRTAASFCARANAMGLSAIKKNLVLDVARTSCL